MRKLSLIDEDLFHSSVRREYTGGVRKEDERTFFGDYEWTLVKGHFFWKEVQIELKKYPGWRLPTVGDLAPLSDQPNAHPDVPGSIRFEQRTDSDGIVITSTEGEMKLPFSSREYIWVDWKELGQELLAYGTIYGSKAFVCSADKGDDARLLLIRRREK